ncbi:hypothetical protein T01_8077 [Trichinella spiralis]|uniref:Uncharacterized protein n=1 Tax=Trichinella spiralis TaxID=6334 RepID=A0A0V1BP03_TRISP|nr:hypothetical protein T01_8077 [Trichinella spiralis]
MKIYYVLRSSSIALTKCCMWTNFYIHIEQCKAIALQKVIKKIAIQHKDLDIMKLNSNFKYTEGSDCKLAASSAPYHFNPNCGVDIKSSCKANISCPTCSIQCNVNRRYVVNYNSALLCSPQIRKHFLFASINMEQQHEMVVNVNILLSDWSRFFICVQQFISLLSSNPYGLPHLCNTSEQSSSFDYPIPPATMFVRVSINVLKTGYDKN